LAGQESERGLEEILMGCRCLRCRRRLPCLYHLRPEGVHATAGHSSVLDGLHLAILPRYNLVIMALMELTQG